MYLQCVYLALLTYHTSPIQSSLGSGVCHEVQYSCLRKM